MQQQPQHQLDVYGQAMTHIEKCGVMKQMYPTVRQIYSIIG